MYRIAVVGSKPKFTHSTNVRFQEGYFANAAAARAHLYDCENKTGVISHYLLDESKTPQLAACYQQIQASPLRSFIALGGKDAVNGQPTEFVSQRTISWLTFRALGPTRFLELLQTGNWVQTLRSAAKLLALGFSTPTKPSTGLAAVLIAMSRVPPALSKNVEVSVFGVGLANDGYDYVQGSYERGHLTIDGHLVAALQQMGVKFVDL